MVGMESLVSDGVTIARFGVCDPLYGGIEGGVSWSFQWCGSGALFVATIWVSWGYPLVVLNCCSNWSNRVEGEDGCGIVGRTTRSSRQGLIFDPFEPLIGSYGISGRRSCLL